jgi:hypothetical protein
MKTGDVSSLSQLAARACSACEAIEGRIAEVYGGGGRLEGDGWRVMSLSHLPIKGGGEALVNVGIAISPQAAYTNDGTEPSSSPASRGSLDFRLSGGRSDWRVNRLDATQ